MKFKIKKNKGLARQNVRSTLGGFTIVEAIVAVFILSVSISAMLGLTISSYSSAKYANNELTANYLLQEAIDSIRNSRDTLVFQQAVPWATFIGYYNTGGCFSNTGCGISIDSNFNPSTPISFITACPTDTQVVGTIKCSALNFNASPTNGSYYSTTGTSSSRFKRQVKMNVVNPNEVEVIATVEYPNGTTSKTRTLKMNLLNWQN